MYSIQNIGAVRMIELPQNDGLRFRFFKEDGSKIKLKAEGSKLRAFVTGKIVVKKLPHTNTFHREYMRQNGLALYRGLQGCDTERLVENMLECVEIV